MARVTAENLINRLNDMIAEGERDERYVGMLEDITDSISDVDLSSYTSNSDVEALRKERDDAIRQRDDYRDRYINRFYSNYSAPNDKGYIEGEISQDAVEKEEKDISYEDLFE